MHEHSDPDGAGKVVYLRPPRGRREALRRIAGQAADATAGARRSAGTVIGFLLVAAWQLVRVSICALLVLMEPLLRATLVPLAFLSFLVTLIFGFLIGDPRFPRWGMLAFSVGALLAYWLFLGLMSLFMQLPPDHGRYR